MSVTALHETVPTSVAAGVLALLILTLGYSLVVTQTVVLWFVAWVGVLGAALVLFVVHLFYRLVVAHERIADSLSTTRE